MLRPTKTGKTHNESPWIHLCKSHLKYKRNEQQASMFNNNTSCFSGQNVPSTGQMTDAQGNLLHLRQAHNRPLSSSSSMQLIICVIAKIWRLRRRDTFICDWGRTHFDCEWISHGWYTFKMSEGGRGGKENRMLINKLIFLRSVDDSAGFALSWNGEKTDTNG